jgi:hypothetical protein
MVDLARNFGQFPNLNSMTTQTAEFGPLNSKWAIPSLNSYIQTGTKVKKVPKILAEYEKKWVIFICEKPIA